MKKRLFRSRKARYGGITVLLTVLLITAVVLLNAVVTTLSERYRLYTPLGKAGNYDVTELCYQLLGAAFDDPANSQEPVEIIFCEPAEELEADATELYLYRTATALAERFPDRVTVRCVDIWSNPTAVKPFAHNPMTGENDPIYSTSVIISSGSYYRLYALEEFFVFEDNDSSKLWGYDGEKTLAAGILRAVTTEKSVVYLTENHGEAYNDFELFYILDDAGYELKNLNLYTDEIPADCDLLILYNPNSDLTVSDGISATSEVDKLEAYLAEGGHSFLTFIGNATPSLPNLEAFLEKWGIASDYHTNPANGATYRYMVQDTSGSITSDGYTIYGVAADKGDAAGYLDGIKGSAIFKNATSLRAANGFVHNGDGSYTNGARTMYSLYRSSDRAVSWANGSPVSGSSAILFSLTEQENASGASYVSVVASTEFASESFLQTAVYQNPTLLFRLFSVFGKTNTPEGLQLKPFSSENISIITTAQMLRWTIGLALLPAVAVPLIAFVILRRRGRA